jgi:hypothetical protein
MSACNCVVASKQHICEWNCIEISKAFSMDCQVYYKVRFRIDVVRFWLQSKHTLDPSVQKTYCVASKHSKRKGSTYFLALCLYTNHLFHIQPSPFLFYTRSLNIHTVLPNRKSNRQTYFQISQMSIDWLRLRPPSVSKFYATKDFLSLSFSFSLSLSHTHTHTHNYGGVVSTELRRSCVEFVAEGLV